MNASALNIMLATPAAGAPAAPEPEKMICRRYAETGSLVKKRRVCHTAKEWARIGDLANAEATRFVEEHRSRPSGGQ